ncbi:MAG: hypothetical protein JWR69_3862 [Pedosphaera sp.]|nr:hypothetical protein [Pedosphaera sp.]
MKQFISCILVLCVTAGNLLAQAQIVKERAKQQRDANNQRQGIESAPPYAPPPVAPQAPGSTPTAPRALNPAQQQAVDKLQADLTGIKAGSPVTPEQRLTLQSDFLTLAKGVAKPSKESLTKLANDLSTALANKNVSSVDRAVLAKTLNVVVNSGNLPVTQAQAFVTTAQNSLKASGVIEPELEPVIKNLQAIVAELQKSKPKLYQ